MAVRANCGRYPLIAFVVVVCLLCGAIALWAKPVVQGGPERKDTVKDEPKASTDQEGQRQGGQEQEEKPVKLPPVLVTSTRVEKPLVEVPAAVAVVEKEDIQLGRQQLGLDESLVRVPGLFMQNRYNFDQDLRISIRGFGARAGFGIRGVKILIDGIPETLPDGQAQVDNVDLGSAGRIEVLRGPASSLYGNASGGVINIVTEDGPETPFVETRLSAGDDGFQKYHMKAGGQLGSLNYLLSLSRMTLDGFREHSGTENVQFNGKFRLSVDETSDLTTLVNFTDSPMSQDPGSLKAAQAASEPTSARDRNVQYDSGEQITQGRLGMVYRKRLAQGRELTARGYYVFRDFTKKLPFEARGATGFDRLVLGGGVKYVHTGRIAGRRHRLTVGLDAEFQNDDRRRFNNHNGQIGELTLNQDEAVSAFGPFVQDELTLADNLELTLGARFDRVRFRASDWFLADGDDSGERVMEELSPMVGVLYRVSNHVNFYGNVSTSFETPTTAELFNPSGAGGFNPSVGPQRATNYEVGVKGDLGARLSYETAVFTIRVKDELIPFELPDQPGRTFYRNAGASTRNGVEMGAVLRPAAGLALSATYTYSDFYFEKFQTEDGVFDGNQIPGIPRSLFFGDVSYFHPSGLYGVWEVVFAGSLYANNANTVKVDSYTVSNLRLGYVGRFGHWEVSPFLGLNNLLDERYNSNVRINAFGGRYFEPAPDFNAYGGLSLSYLF